MPVILELEVLSQVHADREHVISYASHLLTKAERNYCVNKEGAIGSRPLPSPFSAVPYRSEIHCTHRPWCTDMAPKF